MLQLLVKWHLSFSSYKLPWIGQKYFFETYHQGNFNFLWSKTMGAWLLCPQLRRSWGGILVWACPSVRLSIRLSVRNTWQLRNPRTAYARILKFYMKNKRTRIFFFLHQSFGSGVMPLFQLCMKNLVNRISGEPLKLESWYLAYSYRPKCRWTD